MMEDRTSVLRVINGNPKPVHGRYAGKDYVFKPKVPVDVPEVVARHIFGFGMNDKTQALNRLGWARSSDEIEAGMEMLGNVTFDDPPEMIEAPPKAKSGKKKAGAKDPADETDPAGPPVEVSGTEGGGMKSPPTGPKIGEEESAEGDDSEF
jgi:hypothetical protein